MKSILWSNPLKWCAALSCVALLGCPAAQPRPTPDTDNFFQRTGKGFKKALKDEAEKFAPLPPHTLVIGYLEDSGRRNLTYVPSELHVARGQEVPVSWIAWDGKLTLTFRKIGGKPTPIVGDKETLVSDKKGDVHFINEKVKFDQSEIPGTRYHYTVKLTPDDGTPDLIDDECPPIIVD